jgi:hypothetical protein
MEFVSASSRLGQHIQGRLKDIELEGFLSLEVVVV